MWEPNSWNDWRRRGNGEGPNSWPPSARKRGLRLVNLWRSPSIRPGCTHSIQRQDSASGARLTGDSQRRRFVMHRKPTIVLLLAAALLVFVGCSSDTTTTTTAGETTTSMAPETTTSSVSDLSGQTIEVAAVWSGAEQANFQKIIDAFQEQSGVQVTFTSTGDQIATILGTRMPVSYTHLRAHETDSYLVCRLLLEKKKKKTIKSP